MITESLDSLVTILATYKYLLLFPVSIVEGPIVSVIAGFLCSNGIMNLWIAYAVLIMGDVVGDTMYYSIGRWGGRHFIRKWGHFFGIDEQKVIKLETHFENHAGKTILIGKTQALGMFFLVAAGLSKMSYWKFIWFNLIGTSVKSLILLFLGYFLGHAYKLIDQYLGVYAIIASTLLIAIVFIYFLVKQKKL